MLGSLGGLFFMPRRGTAMSYEMSILKFIFLNVHLGFQHDLTSSIPTRVSVLFPTQSHQIAFCFVMYDSLTGVL